LVVYTSENSTLKRALFNTFIAIVDKESKLTYHWRRVILIIVCKSLWEDMDKFGESLVDTVQDKGE
jgi:hypothetical protein